MMSKAPDGAAGSPKSFRLRRLIVTLGATLTLTGVTIGTAVGADFGPLEPVAVITTTPATGTAPLTVTFDGSGSLGPNTLVSWAWSFGDGGTGSGVQATHVYTTAGTYAASLVVTDVFGLTSLPRTVFLVVNAPTPPAAPTNLTATALSKSSISLSWTNATTDQSAVTIERCKGSGCTKFATVATLPGSATAFTDTKLSSRTAYTYRVRAGNATGNSAYSNLASARTLK